MTNKTNMIVSLLFSCLLCSSALQAADLPDYYPPSFRTWGTLDRLDIQGGEAVIGDMKMILSGNIHVYTLNSRFSSVHSLQPGMKVGVAMAVRGNEAPLITDIWVLPDDYTHAPR